ncbi:MAG: hypothetical protein ACK5MQ_10230 [Pikeienuella sp.]
MKEIIVTFRANLILPPTELTFTHAESLASPNPPDDTAARRSRKAVERRRDDIMGREAMNKSPDSRS